MEVQECLQKLREIKDVAFATVDRAGRPQVRMVDVMAVEGESLYFLTARGKSFYQELMETGQVAITGLTKDYQSIRVQASVRKAEGQESWLERIFQENSGMNQVYPGESRSILEVFRTIDGQVEYFDLSGHPIFRQSFPLGQGTVSKKGFWIEETCIACGRCLRRCPQQCITAGTPYGIRQEQCLHCGLCQEVCPVKAVKRNEI